MKTAVHIAHVSHNLAKGHSTIVTLDVPLSLTCTCHFKAYKISNNYDFVIGLEKY